MQLNDLEILNSMADMVVAVDCSCGLPGLLEKLKGYREAASIHSDKTLEISPQIPSYLEFQSVRCLCRDQ